ncbi:uncharacterized protein LOC126474230 [Schistocerca serialis cubense]|uniref:uncharacterized protein LOC126474230 n=1 Tax=Schistocerca serialis cubense TaxID=2023355 RepID=UPI00214DFFC6|nr:uncharacterized protein LOC126474230 [Schistocerca serialis cubense]
MLRNSFSGSVTLTGGCCTCDALVATARDARQAVVALAGATFRWPAFRHAHPRCTLRSRNHHQYKGGAASPRHQSTTANRRRHHEDSRVPVCGAGCGVRGSGCAGPSAPTTSWPSADPCCAQGDPAWQRAGLLRCLLPIRRRLSTMTMENGYLMGIAVDLIQTSFG